MQGALSLDLPFAAALTQLHACARLTMAAAHPRNAPGPFYVVDGCCLSCAVWTSVAPDLFAFDDNHCYVKQQPRSQVELDRMLVALWAAEVSCIRYRGHAPAIFERLGAMGQPELCDSPPPEEIPVVLRNHVAFDSADHHPRALGEAVEDFRSFFVRSSAHKLRSPAYAIWSRRLGSNSHGLGTITIVYASRALITMGAAFSCLIHRPPLLRVAAFPIS